MASQTKITSFYRPTKANSSAAAAKRRKAVINDPVIQFDPNSEIKPVLPVKEEALTRLLSVPDVKSDMFKTEAGEIGNSKNIFTECGKSVQKKPSIRKSKKTTKTVEKTKKNIFSKSVQDEGQNSTTEIIKEEVTSVSDTHDYNPIEISTPKAAHSSATSCRKRKMQCIEEQSEVIRHTPEKSLPPNVEAPLSTKVRKRLEMGNEKMSENKLTEEIKAKGVILGSPSKSVAFLCMGSLSPRKHGISSPIKTISSPLAKSKGAISSAEKRIQNLSEKGFKSSAVRSLTSMLDKVPSSNKVIIFLIIIFFLN